MLKIYAVLLFSCLFGLHAERASLILMTEDYRPFQFRQSDGKLSGFAVELMREVFKDAKVEIRDKEIVMQAWARSYRVLQEDKNSALFMTTRNEKREKLFKWVGPIAPRAMWFYSLKKNKNIVIESKADLKKYRIGSVRGSASTNNMIKQGLNLDLAVDDKSNMKKFLRGRFDLLAAIELSMNSKLQSHGMQYSDVKKHILLNSDYSYYLAVNVAVPDDVVLELQKALDAMKEDGRYDKLYKSYLRSP